MYQKQIHIGKFNIDLNNIMTQKFGTKICGLFFVSINSLQQHMGEGQHHILLHTATENLVYFVTGLSLPRTGNGLTDGLITPKQFCIDVILNVSKLQHNFFNQL